ncbi:MAG: efflux RND transporter periplasmic adaptor subunit [Alphaproteobacteria bacterium]|nr:efflux RND transporter periplasmic adaptor subunit [Alphaproteobacteria bacterium]
MRRYGLTFLLVVAAAAALGWLLDERVLAPPLMRTTTPRWGSLAEGVYATGVVEPIEWAKVRTEATGRLLSLLREEGQDVVAGDLLAQIDDQKRRARLVEIESRIRYLEAERDRLRVLVGGGIASRKALELVDSDLDQARALRSAAMESLREARVTAPISGRILRREGRVGEVVDAGMVLFWIGGPTQRQIVADIDEEYFPRVRLHQRALAAADAFPGVSFPGRISELTPFGDAGQRAYRIKIVLDEPSPAREPLPLGTTVEVNIVVRAAERALLVPRAALAGAGLWIVEGGRAAHRRVSVGLRGRDVVEILDGLSGGEEVILDPPASLRSDARVRSLRIPAP